MGLFTLFFAEMWERFSFYGMRALLLFYTIKGFLGYNDTGGYAIYGAYTALVYMTPFFGGMLADQLLGARRAVVLGGLLMAAGQFCLAVPTTLAFYTGLALLITGNGFFKPNISTIVGSLYPQGSPKRDGGFTIFYMGINLGAAMSPLLCGYIGETIGYRYGFGLAGIGMLLGVVVFVAPTLLAQIVIGIGAIAGAIGLFVFRPDNPYSMAVSVFVGAALLVAAVISMIALGRGGLPKEAGAPPASQRLRPSRVGPLPAEWAVYLGTLLFVPVFALLVWANRLTIIDEATIKQFADIQILTVLLQEVSKPAGLILLLCGLGAFAYLGLETFRLSKVPRERMFVVLILTFFSMLFWAFFEQAGSSVNNFTDRNVDRVFEARVLTAADVGQTIRFRIPAETKDAELLKLPLLTQEQFGQKYGNPDVVNAQIADAIRQVEGANGKNEEDIDKQVKAVATGDVLTITGLTYLREAVKEDGKEKKSVSELAKVLDWSVTKDDVGMAVGGSEMPASVFQAVNAIYIVLFGVVFSALWTFLGTHGLEPNTPVKFALGLLQLGLGFGAFWYGAQHADSRGMVGLTWLFLGYLLHTTGELCISPVGLSMVTKLSPARLVSTVMGMWFLATAFSQFLAAVIAQFTVVSHGDGGHSAIPIPKDTVNVYGDVFYHIAVTAIISAVLCFALSPLLHRWMHEGVRVEDDGQESTQAALGEKSEQIRAS